MTVDVKIPSIGESVVEATIGQWLKKDGDWVEMDEPICEIESDKATMEVAAEESGKLEIVVKEGETVGIGTVIARIRVSDEKPAAEKEGAVVSETETREETAQPKEKTEDSQKSFASPVALEILREAGLSAEFIRGTGINGRITKEDALRAVAEKEAGPGKEARERPEEVVLEKEEKINRPEKEAVEGVPGKRSVRREKLSQLRKTIARRLVTARNETAMLTTFNEIDMSALIEARNRYKDSFQKKYGVKLGFMSFFVRASVLALQEFPRVNAHLEGDEMVYPDYCDISIAVSTERGLVVPVIFNAQSLTLAEIEREILRLAQKARENRLTIEEMTGGTFSITNGGVFGSLMSTPLLNAPQSAILGMHKIQERPVAVNGEVAVRPMMYVALSYDHRVIDGKESVSFLVRLKELLEDPLRMLIEI
ncbi:MAG: 2-oxoglutarate dehydrogenase complex dihydrolipoyllysine-residue succinyltransferase [Calditrichaeota bacterium]|nr:2-oxoglutarate dehydrogenase complex dihydrolipoyllysine-residue succinyltransferase [Calditrichota bacterium]